ncbi:MAG: GAF domain-containing protein [Roseiflexaceae bacterium]|nr:GAF domain-containing protein [Roseiflexaceae bacterium]
MPDHAAELEQHDSLQYAPPAAERGDRVLDALYNITLASRGQSSFLAIFTAVYQQLRLVFPLDACYLAVCDNEQDQLFRAVLLVDEGVAEYFERVPFGSLTGAVMNARQPRLYRDLAEDRASLSETPNSFGNRQRLSRSWLGVPLLVGANAVGVVSLQSYAPDLYGEADIDLLQRLSNVIAVVIENAWLDQREHDLRGALASQVSQRTTELLTLSSLAAVMVQQRPLPELMDRALDLIVPLFGLDAGTVRVLDQRRDGLALLAQRGFAQGYVEQAQVIPLRGSAPGKIVRENAPLVIERDLAGAGLPWLAQHLPYTALLGVPLRVGERVLGALSLFGVGEQSFPQDVVDLAQALGNQIAIAVENAQLFAGQQRQIRELDTIGHIGQIVSASYNLDEILREVYRALDQVLQSSVFFLLICEPQTRAISHSIFIEEGTQVTLDWQGQPPRKGSLSNWIIEQREPLLLEDVPNQREELAARGIAPQPVGQQNMVYSWVGVPLLSQEGEPIGVLALQDYTSYRYDSQTIDFLTQIATHISLGIQKVRLFAAEQEARRTADTLREVARVLSSSFDTRALLALVLRELKQVITFDTATIMQPDGDVLRVVAAHGFAPDQLHCEISLRVGVSAAGLVVQTRQPYVIPDISVSPDWSPALSNEQTRSWLGVPLIAKGMLLGVLCIDARVVDHFTPRDVEVAQAFASQSAVALENARLYEESVTRVEQELEIARRIQSNLFPHALPQLAGLELDARCIPARETGGDFFDFVVGEDEQAPLALFVGDASGKSIPGAMLMAIARSIVRSEARDHQTPELVMRETNRWVAQDVPPRTFVALCYATLDLPQRRLALANAGQLTPLRRRANGLVDELEVSGPRLPLGIAADTPYEALEVQLEPGDLVLLFTDGIVEAKNAQRELFGFARVEALLDTHGHLPPSQLCDQLLAAIAAFTGDTPPHDDMTLVALRVA